jgi:hypothetical protein
MDIDDDDGDVAFSSDDTASEGGQVGSDGDADEQPEGQRPAAGSAPATTRSEQEELLGGELSSEAALLQLQVGRPWSASAMQERWSGAGGAQAAVDAAPRCYAA